MGRAFVVLSLLLVASAAGASPQKGKLALERAGMALDELDYAKARRHLQRALRAGDHDRRSLARVHQLAGQVAAAFGNTKAAYDHYRRMLALAPDARLPGGLAPKLIAPFERARRFMADRALHLRVRDSSVKRLVVEVVPDPLHMAVAVRGLFHRGGRVVTVRSRLHGGRAQLRIPAHVDVPARVRAVDRYGNELDVIDTDVAIDVPEPKPRAEPARERRPRLVVREAVDKPRASRPLYARWYTWGVAAAAGTAVSVYFGLAARDDWKRLDQVINDSTQYSFQAAYDLERSGRHNQLYSNIAAGVSIGMAGIAGYLLLRNSNRDEKPGKLVAAPVVTAHGASIAVKGSF